MYKWIPAILFALGVIVSPTFVFAQNGNGSQGITYEENSKVIESVEEFQKMKDAKAADLEAKQAEIQAKKDEAAANKEARMMEAQEKRDEKLTERCEQVAARVQNRLNGFETNVAAHSGNYKKVIDKLDALTIKLDANDYDTTNLKDNIAQLDTMVRSYSDSYSDFISILEESKGYACGESEGQYKAKIQASREALTEARSEREQIREYFNTNIKAELNQIRSQRGGNSQ